MSTKSGYQPLVRFLTNDVNDPCGNKDFTESPNDVLNKQEFSIQPPAGQEFIVERILGEMRTGAGVTGAKYGNITATTWTGMEIYCDTGIGTNKIFTLTETPIKSNDEWASYCFDFVQILASQASTSLAWKWSFNKFMIDGGKPPGIFLSDKQRLVIKYADDMDVLGCHTILAQGLIINRQYGSGSK